MEYPHCRDARSVVEAVAGLSDKVTLEAYNLLVDTAKAEEYSVDKVPTVCIIGQEDHGIRYHGVLGVCRRTACAEAVPPSAVLSWTSASARRRVCIPTSRSSHLPHPAAHANAAAQPYRQTFSRFCVRQIRSNS